MGQYAYSLMTGTLTATMKIVRQSYSLAQAHNDPALIMGSYRHFAVTLYYRGDFDSARQYAMRGLQIWQSGVRSPVEELIAPAVECLSYEALSEWHLGEIASCKTNMAEAIALAKELNDMAALGLALYWAGLLAHFERNAAEVERLALELIELCTRQPFQVGSLEELFFVVGRAALPVTRQKASSGSRKGYETIKQPARFCVCHIFWH